MSRQQHDTVLRVKEITKRFPGVIALDDVSIELHAGEVTAIIGENGAGKSTLMKVLSGIYHDYDGEVIFKNKKVRFSSPKQAQEAGVAIIHQELNLIPHLSVRENFFLGREITNRFGLLNTKEMNRRTKNILATLKQEIEPDALISTLKVGQQQVVEIGKALIFDADVIIMDEPTSAISDQEVEVLFDIIRRLKSDGKTIAYISHKLDELTRISDRYVVLRDGKLVDSGEMQGITQDEIIHKMVGREMQLMRKSAGGHIKQECLKIENLSLGHPDLPLRSLVKKVSFTLMKGEIIGIFGLMGAGRTELLETIYGLHPRRTSGNIFVNKKLSKIASPSAAIEAGIGLVPEDRKSDGLILGMDVKANISLASLKSIEKYGLLNHLQEQRLARSYIDQLYIKTSSEHQRVGNLSGGNQQKIILAKWLATHPQILLLDEPTRGIDINAKNEIYKLMNNLASEGLGIVMVSSELPEILTIADRIIVMAEGQITGTFNAAEVTEERVMEAAIPQTV